MKNNTSYIFILSFVFFASTCFLILYTREQIEQKIEVVRLYNFRSEQNKNFDFGNQLKTNLENLNTQESIIKQSFLNPNETLDFITQIESLAESFGLEIVIENVEDGTSEIIEEKYTIKPVTLNIQVKGAYSQVEEYINAINQFQKILIVKELKLYKDGQTNYTARIKIEGVTMSYE